ncbi:MAG: CRISPR-associated RAMP protein [Chloroflexi bacterium]|nr:CRISPR-associated RAMP protein [Chloroflexota bacterium]
MLKQLVNEAHFMLTITTTGPVLVRSGHATLLGPDMAPVLTFRDGDWQVYLPGSSLKGVLRSHLEKVCRTLRPDPVVCNPFWLLRDRATNEGGRLVCSDYPEIFCGNKFERRSKPDFTLQDRTWRHQDETITSVVAYRDSCPICRLFGSTEFIGRMSIDDAYLTDSTRPRPTETRDGVGIDRLTGGAAHGAKFDLEAVSSNVVFQTEVHLRNFETWQLGMILLATQDMADGLVRIGSGRSRGLGSVQGQVDQVVVSYIGTPADKPVAQVWGLGKFLGADSPYGTQPDDMLTVDRVPTETWRGIRRQATFSDESLADLCDQAIAAFVARLQKWSVPEQMQWTHLGFA